MKFIYFLRGWEKVSFFLLFKVPKYIVFLILKKEEMFLI